MHLLPAPDQRPALAAMHVHAWCVSGSCAAAGAKAPPQLSSSGNVCPNMT